MTDTRPPLPEPEPSKLLCTACKRPYTRQSAFVAGALNPGYFCICGNNSFSGELTYTSGIPYTADQMHAYANTCTAAKDARIAELERLVIDAAYTLDKARIWNGMGWTCNPLHPVHYTPMRERLHNECDNIERARSTERQSMTPDEKHILDALANRRTVIAPDSSFGDTGIFSGNYARALEFARQYGLVMLEDHPNAAYIFTKP